MRKKRKIFFGFLAASAILIGMDAAAQYGWIARIAPLITLWVALISYHFTWVNGASLLLAYVGLSSWLEPNPALPLAPWDDRNRTAGPRTVAAQRCVASGPRYGAGIFASQELFSCDDEPRD